MHSTTSSEGSRMGVIIPPFRSGHERYGLIIPACNEEECLEIVIRELKDACPGEDLQIAVGVNGSTDRTAQFARAMGLVVAETEKRGYGYGCQAAIDELDRTTVVDAYIFLAADGANNPRDIGSLITAHRQGYDVVLGSRTTSPSNWKVMQWHHVAANLFLGAWAFLLTGHPFRDIGPLRLISRETFRMMQLREWTYGWTIEAQIRAVQIGAAVCEVPVQERHRLAGKQKVSRVSWRHSFRIGLEIFYAGWRTRVALPDRAVTPARPLAPAMEAK